ncbi:MAG: hypothetical protein H0W76_02945 [Pyrinomonadaceae bacterium]|nr:hypothetical protein [Pyrinomonadaceae bacterium]
MNEEQEGVFHDEQGAGDDRDPAEKLQGTAPSAPGAEEADSEIKGEKSPNSE